MRPLTIGKRYATAGHWSAVTMPLLPAGCSRPVSKPSVKRHKMTTWVSWVYAHQIMRIRIRQKRLIPLPQTLKSLERSSAVNYCSSRKACFLTRSINHFTMGWFGAGYPKKPQWNGMWWVVHAGVTHPNSVPSTNRNCSKTRRRRPAVSTRRSYHLLIDLV